MDPELYAKAGEVHDLLWSTKLVAAEQQLRELERRHPIFSLMLCELFVTRSLLSEKKEDYQAAAKYITEVRKKCSSLYHSRKPALKAYLAKMGADIPDRSPTPDVGDSDEEDGDAGPESEQTKNAASALWARSIGAEAALMDSAIKFKLQKYVKGVLDFRKSWKTYEECQMILEKLGRDNAEVPQLKEIACVVDFGVGIFKFACSRVPRQFQWIVEGIGFKADAIAALEDLKRSAGVENMFRHRLSTVSLAWIHGFFYFDYESGHTLLDAQLAQFPDSPALHFVTGYVLRKEGKIDQSNASFNRAFELAAEPPEFQVKIHYELGYNYYIKHDWKQAIEHLTPFYEHRLSEVFRAYCAYQLGFCHLMLKDKATAVKYFKQVSQYVRKNFAFDEFGQKQAKKYLKKKQYTVFEVLFVQAMLSHEGCDFPKTLELLEKMEGKENGIADNARKWYLRGSCAAHMGDSATAKEFYVKVIQAEKQIRDDAKQESFTLPWCYAGLCELHLLDGDLDKAEALLKKCKSFSGYDFENFLGVRIRKAEDDIRVAKQKQS
mmetsp:Transcript_15911/g.62167  ORF Transcript_15911/g.62167 Transcript_15911/m.62167 type:complete len:549 (+) Transcript_15911:159-1805(+)